MLTFSSSFWKLENFLSRHIFNVLFIEWSTSIYTLMSLTASISFESNYIWRAPWQVYKIFTQSNLWNSYKNWERKKEERRERWNAGTLNLGKRCVTCVWCIIVPQFKNWSWLVWHEWIMTTESKHSMSDSHRTKTTSQHL